jgi:hypothetical protein
MKKKSILVATPGQTEQEYLAIHLAKMKFAYCTNQKKYSLQHSLEEATLFPYIFIS